MNSFPRRYRAVKPCACESEVLRHPIAPCEILPRGLAGVLAINSTHYVVEVLGDLPEHGEPVIDGYRLTKPDGTAHDLCIVAGRLECTCGDYEFRRAAQTDPVLMDCKHCAAVRKHFVRPVDQYQSAAASDFLADAGAPCPLCGKPCDNPDGAPHEACANREAFLDQVS